MMTQNNLLTIAERFGKTLLRLHLQCTVAESCTGGYLAQMITAIPGSSQWFERGFVTYSNTAKQEMLGVNEAIISQFGAVSEQTAQAMAEGALRHSHAHTSAAITGIAGPEGGSAEKPVGTVWFACAGKSIAEQTQTYHCLFEGSRQTIREQAVAFILQKWCDLLIAQTTQ